MTLLVHVEGASVLAEQFVHAASEQIETTTKKERKSADGWGQKERKCHREGKKERGRE